MKTLIIILLLSASTLAQGYETFWSIYEKNTIAEKKEIWKGLTKEQQIEVRRINFDWGIAQFKLDQTQRDYLNRFSKDLPNITREELDEYQDEADKLFSYKQASLLFGSIGPFKPCSIFIPARMNFQPSSCPCSIGSGFNMSCSGECMSPNGRCTTTQDGCGFAWMYACTGWCQAG